MTGFDRSKFKGSSIASLKDARKKAEKQSKSYGSNGGRAGFHKIEEGMNVLRIAPAHDSNDPSYRPLRTAWFECEVPELDSDREETGKTITVKKRIYIATVHGENIKEDPIETYIKYAYLKAAEECSNKEEKATYLAPITGWKDKSQKWHPGVRPSTNYVFYAWKDDELGRIEMYPQILKKMEELNIDEEADEMIEVDCFSDPDNGVSLLIEYDKKAKSGEKYKTKKREFHPKKYKNWEEFMETERVSDEQLKELLEKESLKEMYVNVYSQRDFDLALNGLAIFDENNGYGIFDNEEFLTDLEEIRKSVPEKTEKQAGIDGDDIEKNFAKGKKPSVKKNEEEEVEDTSTWSKPKCRKLLTAYILDNYGTDEVLPELSIEEIRQWTSLALKGEELPFSSSEEVSENEVEIEEEEDDSEVDAPEVSSNTTVADRIAAMRKKAGK